MRVARDLFKFALIAFLIITPFRFFVAQPFIVSGASMEPTFDNREYLVIDQFSYRFEEVGRGDTIIFRYPLDSSLFLLKRVVGLPGERVDIHDGVVSVYPVGLTSALVLDEPYLAPSNYATKGSLSVTLESDEYFVLGDNRSASSDSRIWGPLPKKFIVGRTLMRLLPVERATFFPGAYHFGS